MAERGRSLKARDSECEHAWAQQKSLFPPFHESLELEVNLYVKKLSRDFNFV